MRKPNRPREALRILTTCRSLGIRTAVMLIAGFPTETQAQLNETYDYLLEHAGVIDFVAIHLFSLVRGSPMARDPGAHGLFLLSDETVLTPSLEFRSANAVGMRNEDLPRVVEAMRPHTSKPLITKLSPNSADIAETARLVIEAGSDGLSVINTLVGMAVDIESRKPVIDNISGGLSGPCIKPVALWKIHQTRAVAAKHNIPVLGQGGITNAKDAVEFAVVGADAIGIGTGLFYDPLMCGKLLDGLSDYLNRHNLGSYAELVGSLVTNKA